MEIEKMVLVVEIVVVLGGVDGGGEGDGLVVVMSGGCD